MTDDGNERQATGDGALDALSVMLDTYGAAPGRWPAGGRVEANALLSRTDGTGAAARALLAEAKALDRLLAQPVAIDSDRLATLAARIAGVASRDRPVAEVIRLPAGRRRPSLIQRGHGQGRWIASAVLAASLMVGIVIGPGSTGVPALQEAADAIGLGGYVEQLALGTTEADQVQEEDVL